MRYLKQEKGNIKYAKRNCEGRVWAGSDCNKKIGNDFGFAIDCLNLCSNCRGNKLKRRYYVRVELQHHGQLKPDVL